ncbi:MAG: hypothetical protein ACI30N_05595 [Muribaculaceae bacterium]
MTLFGILSAGCSHKAADGAEKHAVSGNAADSAKNTGRTGSDNAGVSSEAKSSNAKPTPRIMAIDLIGREISDPDPNGYHERYWKWVIADGEIKDLKILETLVDDADTYVTLVQVSLHARGNYSCDCKLKLLYRYTPENGWKLETVLPISLQIVTDRMYDDCISVETITDLYGTHWYLRNNSDTPLTVYYRTFLRGNTEKHHVTVKANSETKASVWSLDDCKVDYVAKDY